MLILVIYGFLNQKCVYLFVFSIAVYFKAFWSMKLDGGAADDLNAAFFISSS